MGKPLFKLLNFENVQTLSKSDPRQTTIEVWGVDEDTAQDILSNFTGCNPLDKHRWYWYGDGCLSIQSDMENRRDQKSVMACAKELSETDAYLNLRWGISLRDPFDDGLLKIEDV